MKKIVLALFAFLFLSPLVHAQEAFVINDFNTDITINQNAKITVVETIATTFSEDRHGIYRDIRSDGLKINVLSVTDKKGYPRN